MRTTAIRVVRDKDIARFDLGIVGDDAFDRLAHRSQMDGNVRCVDHQFSVGLEDRATEIEPFFHVRRDRSLLQRDPHLLSN